MSALLAPSRLAFAAITLITFLYGVFAHVPFTYENLVKAGIVRWLTAFATWHPWLFSAAAAAVGLSLASDLRRPETRGAARAWLSFCGLASLVLLARPVLSALRNDTTGLWVAGFALLPLAWLGALDLRVGAGMGPFREPAPGRPFSVFAACVGAALLQGALGVALASASGPPPAPGLLGHGLLAQLVLGCGVFAALALAAALADGIGGFEALLSGALAALALAAGVRSVFASLGLTGAAAALLAAGAGAAFVLALAGFALRAAAGRGLRAPDGLGLLAEAVLGWPRHGRAAAGLSIALAAAGTWWACLRLAPLDWGGLIQRTLVLGFGLVCLLALLRADAGRGLARNPGLPLVLLGLLPLAAYRLSAREAGGHAARDYAARDPAFALLEGLLAETADDPSFYAFLQSHTNLGAAVALAPVPVRLVEDLAPSAGFRPHVFVFVIDSLRRDYLSPYNAAVTFTPRIAAFAAEGVVFLNAFTRYGATGLSEPSIWVGGMLPHKLYVTPFRPLNALQSLLEADGYQALVSRDTVLQTVVTPWPGLVELDRQVATRDYDLCRTLDELSGRLRGIDRRRPVFAYTQPQNLHVSQITAQGETVPAGESYPGFHAPYASRLRRLDACFGGFLDSLRELGLLDDSVVILTADHGEMLGEGGRFGHAYLLLPQIVRVPLIVRLPKALAGLAAEPREPAFLTDLAPSLYALAGHGPVVPQPLFGGPLFVRDLAERAAYRRSRYLLASSYGAVYALLSGDASELYVADGVNYQDDRYALSLAGDRPLPIDAATRSDARAAIRAGILEIARHYGVPATR